MRRLGEYGCTAAEVNDAINEATSALGAVDGLLAGGPRNTGLRAVEVESLDVLNRLGQRHVGETSDADSLVFLAEGRALAETIGSVVLPKMQPRRLLIRTRIVSAYVRVHKAGAALNALVNDPVCAGSIDTSLTNPKHEEVNEALDEAQDVLERAWEAERLAHRAMAAHTVWHETIRVPWDKGRELTVTAEAEEDAALGAYAVLKPRTFMVTVFRRQRVRPTVGLTFAYAPLAMFDTYEAGDPDADPAEGASKTGEEIQRSNFLVTLGLSPSYVSWLPPRLVVGVDLHVSPSEDVGIVGLGGSAGYEIPSFGALKVHAGSLWFRHQRPGESFVRETYRGAKLFLGFSISGWPPFLPE